ncbi:MAG TPA: hypothetical protein VI168_03060 [Croceibacterium sp.]
MTELISARFNPPVARMEKAMVHPLFAVLPGWQRRATGNAMPDRALLTASVGF